MGKRPHRACPAPHWAGGDCPSNGRLSTAAAAARRAYRNDSTIIHDAGRFVHCHFIGKGGEKFATFTQSRNEGRGGENERWWITMWKEFKTMQKIFKKIRNSRRKKAKNRFFGREKGREPGIYSFLPTAGAFGGGKSAGAPLFFFLRSWYNKNTAVRNSPAGVSGRRALSQRG